MENPSELLGSKGLIKRQEFLRIIVQCLYSLGYCRSASRLELESGVSYQSQEFQLLVSHLLNGNCDGCISVLNSIKDQFGETMKSVLFLVLRQCYVEHLNRGEVALALDVLRKKISALDEDKFKVHSLAYTAISLKDRELGDIGGCDVVPDLRRKLLIDLEKLFPPPISLPRRRLEHLIETAVTSWVDSCMYHNSSNPVSLYEDHQCGRDQIPTRTIEELTGHRNKVSFVQFSNNGEFLASSSSDCTIIWQVPELGNSSNSALRHILYGHKHAVSFAAWSPDDTKLLTWGNTDVLKLWDAETGKCKHTFGLQGFIVSSCSWFHNSKQFVCGSSGREKGICVWYCDGNELTAWRWRRPRTPKVVDLAVTPNGEYLICILLDNKIGILHIPSNAQRDFSEEHPITSLSVSGDSKFFIVNLNNQEIHMWDVAGNWEKPLRFTGHKQQVCAIRSCFGGWNSKFIASGSEDSHVYIWSCRNSKPIEVLSGHTMTVNCVSWNPKRPKMLASASDDCTIRIWGPNSINKKRKHQDELHKLHIKISSPSVTLVTFFPPPPQL